MLHLTRPEGSEPEDFHISRRGAVSMFFAGYAVAAFSAEAKPVQTGAEGLVIDEVLIPNGAARPLPAYVARPEGKAKHATIIVVNEIFGIHDYIKDVCRRLARLGYAAVAPDYFYRAGVNLPGLSDRTQIMAVVQQATPDQVDADTKATTDWIGKAAFAKKGAIGITGFCWGGTVVWRAAMINPAIKAGVAWYGRLDTITPRAAEVKAPVLGLYGGKDQGIPVASVEAMGAALKAAGKTGSSVHVYPEAGHGFHADYRASFDAAAAKDGWERLLAHFKANGVA